MHSENLTRVGSANECVQQGMIVYVCVSTWLTPWRVWGSGFRAEGLGSSLLGVQGYFAHKKTSTPLGPPEDPRHRPAVGSEREAFTYGRGTPV